MNTDPSKGHLIIDATHGGVKLACEYKKKHNNVYIYDIYNTLKTKQKNKLKEKNIKILNFLDEINNVDYLNVIYPIHLPLAEDEIAERINNPEIKLNFLTHHKAVKEIAKDLEDILKIEITGVKGKTSSAFILKEIFENKHPMLLSSLGIYYNNDLIEKNISITPANILKLIDVAENKDSKAFIIENSLGTSAIGDIGLLTNIVENYPVANKLRDARTAKSQIFNNNLIAANLKTLENHYEKELEKNRNKINSFSIDNNNADLYCKSVSYGLKRTEIKIDYENIKTVYGNSISGKLSALTFAPSRYHVENVLGAICVALSCEIAEEDIVEGLERFKGLAGRTNIEEIDDKIIIKEINPGINTKAIEYSLNMIKDPEEYNVVLGGDYGITCEEIDEESVIELLSQRDELNLTLTGKLGRSIWIKTNEKFKFVEDYKIAIEESLDKNILFIYRSDYRKLNER